MLACHFPLNRLIGDGRSMFLLRVNNDLPIYIMSKRKDHNVNLHCREDLETQQTNSMELCPSWEAISRSATQEFPNIL
jgi:hypothetical protein